jgi:tetratricopeptide (TPR) repeat protein
MANTVSRKRSERLVPRSYWVRQLALPPERNSLPVMKELFEAAAGIRPVSPRGGIARALPITDDLAVELWLRVRSVWGWAEFIDAEQPIQPPRSVFHAMDIPDGLREPLLVLRSLSGDSALSVRIAEACGRIAGWAEEHGLRRTAVMFGEAAAAAAPNSARATHLAGRLNRTLGDSLRAEVYYDRALISARRKKRWDLYVRANLGLGTLKADRGDIASALAHFHSAARAAASESGERWLAAQTAHDLFVLLADIGELTAAEREAVKALEWYPKHHARFPLAVHDYAMVFVRQGFFAVALPLLERVLDTEIPPVDEVIVWSTYARVLGGIGQRSRFREAESKLLTLVALYPHHGSAAHVNLGFGCYSLGLWEEAESYTMEGIRRARSPGSPEAVVGNELLSMVRSRTPPQPSVRSTEQIGDIEFTTQVLKKLQHWRGPTWRRKHQAGPEPVTF